MLSKTNNWAIAAIVCVLAPLLASCADGPTFAEAHAGEPPLKPGYARIYFYRDDNALSAVSLVVPITVDGAAAGRAIDGGFFSIDEPAGIHKITAMNPGTLNSGFKPTEISVRTTLVPGQTRYVRLDLLREFLGYRISPTLIDGDQGAHEIACCRLATR
jgi:hypothetical protein